MKLCRSRLNQRRTEGDLQERETYLAQNTVRYRQGSGEWMITVCIAVALLGVARLLWWLTPTI